MNLSILISSCNRSNSLAKTLESLGQIIIPEGVAAKVILIDNNSRDDTKKIVDIFAARSPLKLEYVFEGRSGKSFALNTGMKYAYGDSIAFTDDDVVVDENWLFAINNAMAKYKDYNCFGGRVIPVWEASPPPWLGTQGKFNALRGTVFLRDDGMRDREYDDTMSGKTPGGVNMFFRRKVIESNGPFRTDLGPFRGLPGGSEDTEYCKRMLKRGERFMYIGGAIVYHPVEPEKIAKKALLRWRYHCARTEIRSMDEILPSRKIQGVPVYFFSILLNDFWHWMTAIESKKKFFYKLKLAYALGEMVEHYSLAKK